MAVVNPRSRQISINSFVAVIAALVVGLFVSPANADRVVYTLGDDIPATISGDATSGDLELNAVNGEIIYTGTVSDVSSTVPTNLYATGTWGTDSGARVNLRGAFPYTGVSTVDCYVLVFKGNGSNTSITSAGFAGNGKIAIEGVNGTNNRNMTLSFTADPSTPQPHTGIFQINGATRLNLPTDVNLSNSTLKLNAGSANYYTELGFSGSAKTVSFKDVINGNYVRFMNLYNSKSTDDLNTISFKSGTYSGELGRMANGGGDLPGRSTDYVNYFNLTKTSDGTVDGGTLTLSGPVYYRGETNIESGTLAITGSDFVTSSALTGSGTLKLSGNNKYFNILSDSPSEFTGTIQLFDESITANSRTKLAAATYSWDNNALKTVYSATDVSLPKAKLVMNGNTSGKYSELAFEYKNSSFTIGTLTDNGYGRILNLDSSSKLTELEDFSTLTVGNGTFGGEIGRRENESSYPYTNYINLVKANDGTADGGTLTLSNKYMDFYGSTTIEGGTLEITNAITEDTNYQYYARSTALKGSGNLSFTGKNWTVFSINTADTATPQEFSGTVNVANSSKIMIKTESNAVKDLNLANATLNVGTGSTVGLHSINSAVSSLTVKELNTQSGSEVRICSNNPGSSFGTLTVGRGEINGTLGQNNSVWNNVNLVKVSDGSEDGGTLTIKGEDYYTGATTIDAGKIRFENNGTGYKYFAASTALNGSGTLELEGNGWIGFAVNASADTPQAFTGSVDVLSNTMIRTSGGPKPLNLGNGTINVAENVILGMHVDNGAISNLTVKELNTESGSAVRLCSNNPGANNYGTLTVGSGTVNGNLGEANDVNVWYNWVNLVKVSDGSDDGGTLTVSGVNLYTGSIDVQAGVLKLTDDATLSKGATTIREAGTLEFEVADGDEKQVAITAANPISGAGQIVKSGSGTLKINNIDSPNTISADSFTVNAGELDFRGYFEGDIEIINGAVFSPGNSVGTLSVTGDVSIINGTALFEFGDYTGADENHDVLTILGADNLFTAGNGMIFLAFDGDPNAWATDGSAYKLVSNEGFTVGDKSSWLSNYTDLFTLDGRSDGLYLVAGASPTPEPGSGVPEPSTWALLVLGVAGLMYVRKRKN